MPLQAALQLPGEFGDPKILGCDPGQEQLWVHIPILALSPFSSPGARIEAKQVQRAEPVLLRGMFGAGGSRGMGVPRARELFPTANGSERCARQAPCRGLLAWPTGGQK